MVVEIKHCTRTRRSGYADAEKRVLRWETAQLRGRITALPAGGARSSVFCGRNIVLQLVKADERDQRLRVLAACSDPLLLFLKMDGVIQCRDTGYSQAVVYV